MRRYHEELPRTIREQRRHLREVHGWPKKPVICSSDLQPGRFRKRHAFDCGKTRCLLCHGDKLLQRPSIKDRIARDIIRDSLEDHIEPDFGANIACDQCRPRYIIRLSSLVR
jgi:hypothetical protein